MNKQPGQLMGVLGMFLGVIVAIVLVMAGCSSTGQVDGPVLMSRPASRAGGMDALIMGTLIYDYESGCLLLGRYDAGNTHAAYPVVWPAGTSWKEDPPAVVLANGQIVEPGMSVRGGGGSLDRDSIWRMAGQEVADAAAACAGPTGEIAIFNLGSTISASSTVRRTVATPFGNTLDCPDDQISYTNISPELADAVGFETPEEALEAYPELNRPPGTPRIELSTDSEMVFVFRSEWGERLGRIGIGLTDRGWFLMWAEKCGAEA